MDIETTSKGKGKGYGHKGKYNNSKGKSKHKGFYASGKGKGCKGGFGQGKGKPQRKGWYQQQSVEQSSPTQEKIWPIDERRKGQRKDKSANNIFYKCANPGHIARDCRVALYNLGEATTDDEQKAPWWNEQHYHELAHQQLALPPTPVPQQAPQAAEQAHCITSARSTTLIAVIGHQQGATSRASSRSQQSRTESSTVEQQHRCPVVCTNLHAASTEQRTGAKASISDQ